MTGAKVERRTPALDAVAAWSRSIGGTWRVEVVPESQATADKLAGLAKTGRPFFDVTPQLQATVARYLRANVAAVLTSGGNLRAEATLRVAGEAIRAHVVQRFERGGNDVRLAPLSPAYAAWKARKGLDPRVGVATRALLAALRASRFVLRRSA